MNSATNTLAKCTAVSLGSGRGENPAQQPQQNQSGQLTYSPIIGSQERPAADALTWIETNISHLTIMVQNVPRYRRGKNRVILETSDRFGTVTVGGPSLPAALFRLRVRFELQRQAAVEAAKGETC